MIYTYTNIYTLSLLYNSLLSAYTFYMHNNKDEHVLE